MLSSYFANKKVLSVDNCIDLNFKQRASKRLGSVEPFTKSHLRKAHTYQKEKLSRSAN